jgi:hypothetical protein
VHLLGDDQRENAHEDHNRDNLRCSKQVHSSPYLMCR